MDQKARDNFRYKFILNVKTTNKEGLTLFKQELMNLSTKNVIQGVHIIQSVTESEFWLYVIVDSQSQPLSRHYFKGLNKGQVMLQRHQIAVIEEFSNSKHCQWLTDLKSSKLEGFDNDTAEFLVNERANFKILTKAEEVKDSDNPKLRLLKEFVAKFTSFKVTSVGDFFKQIYKEGRLEDVFVLSEHKSRFDSLAQEFVVNSIIERKHKPSRESLQEFCKANPLMGDLQPIIDTISKSEFKDVIDAIFTVFVRRDSKKRRAVWLYGAPNSGKTTISEMLNLIFITEVLPDTPGDYTAQQVSKEFSPQIVNFDEVNFHKMFKPDNMSRVKKLLEGRGYGINIKGKDPVVIFENSCVLLTSNGLPSVATNEDQKQDWKAIQVRTKFVCMVKCYTDIKERFPFDVVQLAHYMNDLLHSGVQDEDDCILGKRKESEDYNQDNELIKQGIIVQKNKKREVKNKYNSLKQVEKTTKQIKIGQQRVLVDKVETESE